MDNDRTTPRGLVFAVASAPERRGVASFAPEILQTGIGPLDVDRLVTQLRAADATALVSIGTCGGLAPDLSAGTIVLPAAVARPGTEDRPVASAWHARASATLAVEHAIECGRLISTTRILSTPEDKARAHEGTGAVAVDMESADLAEAAQRIDIPFLVARVVIDAWKEVVPASVMAGIDRAGNATPARMLRAMLARPADVPDLIRLGQRLRSANATLRRIGPIVAAMSPVP